MKALCVTTNKNVEKMVLDAGGDVLHVQLFDIDSHAVLEELIQMYDEIILMGEPTPVADKFLLELSEELNHLDVNHGAFDIFDVKKYEVAGGTQEYTSFEDLDEEEVRRIESLIADMLKAESALAFIKQLEAYKYSQNESITSLKAKILNSIHNNESVQYPTGFPQLDSILDGGLQKGLYVIGAISSLGKTTFALQIADSLAQQDYDALVYSLEMDTEELVTKSISRLTYKLVEEKGIDPANAKSSKGIAMGSRYANYSDLEKKIITDSTEEYFKFGKNLYIYEGAGQVSVNDIDKKVATHIRKTGKKPVVFIDYLQLIAPENDSLSDKQKIDDVIIGLRTLSRKYKISVLVISSFNRSNYNKEANMAAFKESGAVEYTADVLIGMDLHGVGVKGFNEQKAKNAVPRYIDLRILKNRTGSTGDTLSYKFNPIFNHFHEMTKEEIAKHDK